MKQGILIIDDDLNYTQIVKKFLEDKGFRVTIGIDGASALQISKNGYPRVNPFKPQSSGYLRKGIAGQDQENPSRLRDHRDNGLRRRTSGRKDDEGRGRRFLSKPIELKTLLEAIHNTLKLRKARLKNGSMKACPP